MNQIATDFDTTIPVLEAGDLAALLSDDAPVGARATTKARKERFYKDAQRRATTLTTTTKATSAAFMDARGITEAAAAITMLPKPGQYIHGITYEVFPLFDIIPAILTLSRAAKIDQLIFTTLGLGFNSIEMLDNLLTARKLDGPTLHILASAYFKSLEPERWQLAQEHATAYGYTLTAARNHTKIILMQIGRAHYVIEGSSNLRSCRSIEQFAMTNSAKLFKFHENWIMTAPEFAPE